MKKDFHYNYLQQAIKQKTKPNYLCFKTFATNARILISLLYENIMKKQSIIFDTFAKAIIPYILLFGLYVQINGENSPGGGFQASVIIASAIIAYDMIFESMLFSLPQLMISSAFGCMIYLMVGLISIMQGSNYLNYYALAKNKHFGQFIGIFMVELGVGIAVCSVMLLIYSCLGRITSKEL